MNIRKLIYAILGQEVEKGFYDKNDINNFIKTGEEMQRTEKGGNSPTMTEGKQGTSASPTVQKVSIPKAKEQIDYDKVNADEFAHNQWADKAIYGGRHNFAAEERRESKNSTPSKIKSNKKKHAWNKGLDFLEMNRWADRHLLGKEPKPLTEDELMKYNNIQAGIAENGGRHPENKDENDFEHNKWADNLLNRPNGKPISDDGNK